MNYSLLFVFIQFLCAVLVALWLFIGLNITYEKVRSRKLAKIEATFAHITAQYLYPLPGEKPDLIQIQRSFRKVGVVESQPGNVQYLIDLMIRTQRCILGTNYLKLVTLFKQIPPFRACVSKLASRKWYIKARGIREIYEMNQRQHLKELIKERNHKNIFVRREAQIAIVVFLGWESLRFLSYLKREMTLWQQIKIVEKLYDLYPKPNLQLLRTTYQTEKPYAQELIMRIIRKFQLTSEIHYILRFLDHDNFERREAAIYCLSSFDLSEESSAQVKEKFFHIPNVPQQIQLLKYLQGSSKKIDVEFLTKVLQLQDETLKVCAAEILWRNGHKLVVESYYYQQYAA